MQYLLLNLGLLIDCCKLSVDYEHDLGEVRLYQDYPFVLIDLIIATIRYCETKIILI